MEHKKVHFVSLGCPKNLVDSEIMLGHLIKDGYSIVENMNEAETVVINTCGFIEDSKKESISKILEAAKFKESGRLKNLVVAGCLPQRYKEELVEGLPEADLFIGSGEFQNISKVLKNKEEGSSQKTYFHLPTYLQEESSPRINSQPKHRAYLKISEGCLKRCSFCAIPLIRGNLQSRPIESIVKEAQGLVDSGVKEIIIISHDFTDYGWDLRNKKAEKSNHSDSSEVLEASPENLLRALAKIENLKWIRLLYLYPDGVSQETIKIMKENPKILQYFDMPLQHINDEILKKMNRKMNRDEIEKVIKMIRSELPQAVFRTQFIVGFPGETEVHFQELLAFVKENEFNHVGCFKYSPEENTPAGRIEEQIDEKTKIKRYSQLMELQQKISIKKHKEFIGRTLDVIVEGYSEESELLLQGRTFFQAPEIDGLTLINEGEAKTGEIVKVEITESMEYDLIGKIVGQETISL